MDEQREEVYERIPWESLEGKGNDRQWLVIGVAGAVVAAVLGYSFMSNRARPPAAPQAIATTAPAGSNQIAAPPPVPVEPDPAPVPEPITEADLMAVDPERLVDAASAHARWLMREYLAADGSGAPSSVIESLLPADVPPPVGEVGAQVFVEWVDSMAVEQISASTYRVTVRARTMVARDGAPYERLSPEVYTVDINVADGQPMVLAPPRLIEQLEVDVPAMSLGEVPSLIVDEVLRLAPGAEVVGGIAGLNGYWDVVVLRPGADGMTRPMLISVGP
jgi:hypothetical protein